MHKYREPIGAIGLVPESSGTTLICCSTVGSIIYILETIGALNKIAGTQLDLATWDAEQITILEPYLGMWQKCKGRYQLEVPFTPAIDRFIIGLCRVNLRYPPAVRQRILSIFARTHNFRASNTAVVVAWGSLCPSGCSQV